ncbi:hypothetical protein GCM10007924_30290 [Sneathiella chinensis]|uniref:Uncharacterized protein n=1 Tax=Sneathiella chinensis TaxID=349750 RepID=A0ABQ5U6R3_9PROT|nr:hypothetical protein GCM10007924_30290 [Sneathiella chinensis]
MGETSTRCTFSGEGAVKDIHGKRSVCLRARRPTVSWNVVAFCNAYDGEQGTYEKRSTGVRYLPEIVAEECPATT